jgi:hypothetical protein
MMGTDFVGVYMENIVLLVRNERDESDSLRDNLFKPFSPFSPVLWALIIATLSAASINMAFFEHGRHENYPGHGCHTCTRSLYDVSVSFLSGGMTIEPNTLSGRILSLGISFFILITVASFTASTATVLISQQQAQPRVASLPDALQQRKRVCYSAGMGQQLLATYPTLNSFGVLYGDDTICRFQMDAGACDVCLTSDLAIASMHSRGEGCGLLAVGRPVITYLTGFYVAGWAGGQIRTSASRKMVDGTWSRIEGDMFPPSACVSAETGKMTQLQAEHMAGTCLILFLCAVVAWLARLKECHARRRLEGKDTGVPPDLSDPSSEKSVDCLPGVAADAAANQVGVAGEAAANEAAPVVLAV